MIRVVIAGCGFGSIDAAISIKKKLGEQVDVIAINKDPYHTLYGYLPEVIGQTLEPEDINIPLAPIFKKNKIHFVVSRIVKIDKYEKEVILDNGASVKYDYLLIDLGSKTNFHGIEGASKYCFVVKSTGKAVKLQEHIKNQVLKSMHEKGIDKKKTVSVVIIGAGLTGIEVACEINSFLHHLLTIPDL